MKETLMPILTKLEETTNEKNTWRRQEKTQRRE